MSAARSKRKRSDFDIFNMDIPTARPHPQPRPRKRTVTQSPMHLPGKLTTGQRIQQLSQQTSARLQQQNRVQRQNRQHRQSKELEKALRINCEKRILSKRVGNALSQLIILDNAVENVSEPEPANEDLVSDDDEEDFQLTITTPSSPDDILELDEESADEASSSPPPRPAPPPPPRRQPVNSKRPRHQPSARRVRIPIGSFAFAPPEQLRQLSQRQPSQSQQPSTSTHASRAPLKPLNRPTTRQTTHTEIFEISDDDCIAPSASIAQNRAAPSGKRRQPRPQPRPQPRTPPPKPNPIPAGTFYGTRRKSSPFSGHPEPKPSSTFLSKSSGICWFDEHLTLEDPKSDKPSRATPRVSQRSRRRRKVKVKEESDDDDLFSEPCDIRIRPLRQDELATVRSLTFGVRKTEVISYVKQAKIELKANDFSGLRGSRWLNDEVMNAFIALINDRNYRQVRLPLKSAAKPAWEDEDDEICEVAAVTSRPLEVFRRPRPRAYIFNTFFLTRISQRGYDYQGVRRWLKRAGSGVKELDLIMCPVNLSNYHWVLTGIDLRGKRFLYLDSTSGDDVNGTIPLLRRWLHDEVADKYGKQAAADMKIDTWGCDINPSFTPKQKDGGSCGVFTVYAAEYLERGKRPDFTQDNIRTLRQRTALFLKKGKLPEE